MASRDQEGPFFKLNLAVYYDEPSPHRRALHTLAQILVGKFKIEFLSTVGHTKSLPVQIRMNRVLRESLAQNLNLAPNWELLGLILVTQSPNNKRVLKTDIYLPVPTVLTPSLR